jgi:hypothetical protein
MSNPISLRRGKPNFHVALNSQLSRLNGNRNQAMRSRPFQIVFGTAACLAMLGCFINCALEEIDEHGCEDECLSCACSGVLTTKPDASPVNSLPARGQPGMDAISVSVSRSAMIFPSSCPPHFRFRPPDRLYQLHAAYLI